LQFSIAEEVGTVKPTAGETGVALACMLVKGALLAAARIEQVEWGELDVEMVEPQDNPAAGPNLVPQGR
jgi:hypothetical protein